MQVTFCGEAKEDIVVGTDENSEQAITNATSHLGHYGAKTAYAAEYSTTDGLIIHLIGTDDFVKGVHFNSTDEETNKTILEMFNFHPLWDLAEMNDSRFGWAKTPEKFLAGAM